MDRTNERTDERGRKKEKERIVCVCRKKWICLMMRIDFIEEAGEKDETGDAGMMIVCVGRFAFLM